MHCDKLKSFLPDLVLDPTNVPSYVQAHLHTCTRCRKEYDEVQATICLLDEWKVPEPSPYFDSRLAARLWEAKQTEPAGFFERLRMRMLYSGNLQLRPALAAALALGIIVAGGSYAGFFSLNHTPGQTQVMSATVHDLQILDANDQTIQQLNAFDDNSDSYTTVGGTVTSN